MDDQTPVPTVPTYKHWQAVEQLTVLAQHIKMFPSVKHAVLDLQQHGIKAHKNGINACLKDDEREAYGFKWRIAQFS